MLLAWEALSHSASAPVVNLARMNPYVTAALQDWQQQSSTPAFISRQLAPAPVGEVKLSYFYFHPLHALPTCLSSLTLS